MKASKDECISTRSPICDPLPENPVCSSARAGIRYPREIANNRLDSITISRSMEIGAILDELQVSNLWTTFSDDGYGTARRWKVSSLLHHSINLDRVLRDQASESGALLLVPERCLVSSLELLGRPRQTDPCPNKEPVQIRKDVVSYVGPPASNAVRGHECYLEVGRHTRVAYLLDLHAPR